MALTTTLIERRAAVYADMRGILDTADGEGRNLTAEESQRYDGLEAEFNLLTKDISRAERADTRQRELGGSHLPAIITGGSDGFSRDSHADNSAPVLTREQRMADIVSGEGRKLSIGKYVKGIVTGVWDGAKQERDMAIGTLSAGGYLVPTPLSASVIDRARALARVHQAGAVTVPMTAQTLTVAKIVDDPAFTWRTEGSTIPSSDVTLGAVTFTAKAVSTIVKFSRELAEDAQNLDAVVTEAIAGALAVEMDRVALFGATANHEPLGLFNIPSFDKIPAGANGAGISFPLMYQAVGDVLTANYQPSAFIHSPRTEIAISQLTTGTTGRNITEQPLIGAIPRLYTSTVPNTQTQGTASNASSLFVGDWSRLMFGIRTQLVIELLRERYADTGEFGAFVWSRFDVQVVDKTAFAAVTGIIPAP